MIDPTTTDRQLDPPPSPPHRSSHESSFGDNPIKTKKKNPDSPYSELSNSSQWANSDLTFKSKMESAIQYFSPNPSFNFQQPSNLDGQPALPETLTCNEKWKKKVYGFTDHWAFVTVGAIVTVWGLIGDDIRQLAVNVHYDDYFYIITIVCFGFFAVEFGLSCYADPEYVFGFFFWLDLVSTLSLLLDIGWISDVIFDTSTSDANKAKNATQLARAARASRIGTRAGRIVRIIRLIRLLRIVKLYKAEQKVAANGAPGIKRTESKSKHRKNITDSPNNEHSLADHGSQSKHWDKKSGSQMVGSRKSNSHFDSGRKPVHQTPSSVVSQYSSHTINPSYSPNQNHLFGDSDPDEELTIDASEFQETNVGKRLTDSTTKKVIVIVLSILISVPIFSPDTYIKRISYKDSALDNFKFALLSSTPPPNPEFDSTWETFIAQNQNDRLPLIYIKLARDPILGSSEIIHKEWGQKNSTTDLRPSEY